MSLPLNLVGELSQEEVDNRNTYFGLKLNEHGRPVIIHKCVYGEIELEHVYVYADSGKLLWADITDDDGDKQRISF